MINAKENLIGEIYEKNTISGLVNVGERVVSPPLIDLEITPSKQEQIFNHEGEYGYDEVKVNPIPEDYIIPSGTLNITENGNKDVTNFSNVNVNIDVKSDPILQNKSVEITQNGTTSIKADNGYDGLNNVEVVTNVANGGDNTNLFIQEEEPNTKSGIWLKPNSTDVKNIKNINIIGDKITINLGDWNPQSQYQQLPYDFYLGSTAIVGTDIYIFFNATSSGINALYKYDTITNKYTRLSDVPFDSHRSTTSVIGTDVAFAVL